MLAYCEQKRIYPWPKWADEFLCEIWNIQGKTRNNCSGMSSFSFYPQRWLYDANDDSIYEY